MSINMREILLTAISETLAEGYSLQTVSILRNAGEKIGRSKQSQEALLTAWHDLFRTGYLAWGSDLANPNPPFFHLTEQGRKVLMQISRDPGNPEGYLNHLHSVAKLSPIAESYLNEGLDCYVRDLHKAGAVMIGAASEAMALNLRDIVVGSVKTSGESLPRGLEDWQVKKVLTALKSFFDERKKQMDPSLRDEFEAYW